MNDILLVRDCLVLYKEEPARIHEIEDKRIVIELRSGEQLRVRPKDVTLLHPGPIQDLKELDTLKLNEEDVFAAWELLAGGKSTLHALVELAAEEDSPAATWAMWQSVTEGIRFSGTPDRIRVATEAEVAQRLEARTARQREVEEWAAFLKRAAAGSMEEGDAIYLSEVAELALGRHQQSRVLRALGREQTPESAHHFLLQCGYWDSTVNPYPARAGLNLSSARGHVNALPEEARRDLTHLLAVAIDDEGNEDPDDAISWDSGRLWVHVADVAAVVATESGLDLEARARAANLYLPEATVTMLPPLVTKMLGLGLSQRSPALSFGIDLGPEGQITGVEIVPSWVSVTRWSYEEAELHLHEPLPSALWRAATTYAARREKHGAVAISLPEVRVRVHEGSVIITPMQNLRSRMMVQEAMLMAGEAAARFAQERAIPIPHTVQEPPAEDLPAETTMSGMFARRKLLRPSRQAVAPAPHTGLGMELYAQVTSPLRRYLDLVAHQQIRAFLHERALLTEQQIVERIGEAAATLRDLRRTERLSRRHWTNVFLLQNPAWQGEGIVVEHRGNRHVTLLSALDLETDLYPHQDLPLDSEVLLRVRHVNLPYLETSFSLLTSPQSPG